MNLGGDEEIGEVVDAHVAHRVRDEEVHRLWWRILLDTDSESTRGGSSSVRSGQLVQAQGRSQGTVGARQTYGLGQMMFGISFRNGEPYLCPVSIQSLLAQPGATAHPSAPEPEHRKHALPRAWLPGVRPHQTQGIGHMTAPETRPRTPGRTRARAHKPDKGMTCIPFTNRTKVWFAHRTQCRQTTPLTNHTFVPCFFSTLSQN